MAERDLGTKGQYTLQEVESAPSIEAREKISLDQAADRLSGILTEERGLRIQKAYTLEKKTELSKRWDETAKKTQYRDKITQLGTVLQYEQDPPIEKELVDKGYSRGEFTRHFSSIKDYQTQGLLRKLLILRLYNRDQDVSFLSSKEATNSVKNEASEMARELGLEKKRWRNPWNSEEAGTLTGADTIKRMVVSDNFQLPSISIPEAVNH